MVVLNRLVLFVLVLHCIFKLYLVKTANVWLNKFGNCDPNKNDKVLYNLTLKPVGKLQAIDGTFEFKAPIDNHLKANVSISMLVGKEYIYIFSINEKKSCDGLNKFLGELWYDLERQAQLIPGLCPIPKGTYHLHNALLDFNKMTTISNFPFGSLRFICMVYDSGNNYFSCIIVEGENRLK